MLVLDLLLRAFARSKAGEELEVCFAAEPDTSLRGADRQVL
jgi:hypothetical protein